MTASDGAVIRALGWIETRMAVMHREFRGTTQGCQICVLQGSVTRSSLHLAARALFQKYQSLRCVIRDDGEHSYFVEHADIERVEVRHVSVAERDGWRGGVEKAYNDELNTPLDPAVALWRLLLITGPRHDDAAVVLTSHHSIMDGGSMYVLADELLNHVDCVMSGGTIADDVRVPLPPPVDDYLAAGGATPGATPARVAAAEPLQHRRVATLDQRRTVVEFFGLTDAEHRKLRFQAARDRVSVNSLIAAVIGKAFVESALGTGALPLKTAVSLRHLLDGAASPQRQLGCFITVANTPVARPEQQDLRALASDYQATLAGLFTGAGTMPATSRATLASQLVALAESRHFAEGVGLTNVGKVAVTKKFRHFRLVDYAAVANRRAGNAAFVVSPISFEDELSLPVTFTEPLMDRDSIVRFGTTMTRLLSDYASQHAN